MITDTLNYIDYLEDEIEILKRSDESKEKVTVEQHGEIHRLRDELRKVRQDTAKRIVQDWYNDVTYGLGIADTEYIRRYGKQYYDVEVQE